MAFDRIVYWKDKAPPRDAIEKLTRCFFGEAAQVEWSENRLVCTLPGTISPALRGQEGLPENRVHIYEWEHQQKRERWVEVWCGSDTVDVITREQDEFTAVLADGLSATLARFFKGERGG